MTVSTETTSPMTFLELGFEVMKQRKRDGVRGLDREWSRWRLHCSTADFANRDITAIGSPDIRRWLRAMAEKQAEGAGEERKLSRQTISRCQSLVSAVFLEAVEREMIEVNPCIGVRAKRVANESDTKKKWTYLPIEDQQKIASCAAIPIEDRLAIRFAIATGLRQGEQFNLELPDLIVDGDDPHVFVRYGSRPRDGRKMPPKSGKTRKVPLFGDGLASATEWLAMLTSFAPSNPEALVFPSAHGKRRYQGKPLGRSGTLHAHLATAGVGKCRWHDLRHFCGSNLVTGALGRQWPLTEIRDYLGHSQVAVTERYSHGSESTLRDAARATVEAATTAAPAAAAPAPVIHTPAADRIGLLDVAMSLARTTRKTIWRVYGIAIAKAARDVA